MDGLNFIMQQKPTCVFPVVLGFFPPIFQYFLEHWHISNTYCWWYVNWNMHKMNLKEPAKRPLEVAAPIIGKSSKTSWDI